MADEAVLRIIMQGDGSGGAAPTGVPPSTAPSATVPAAPPANTAPPPHTQVTPPRQRTAPSTPPPDGGDDDFDPTDPKQVAKRELDREDFKARVQIERENMRRPSLPSLPGPTTEEAAKDAAKAIIEKRKLLALIDAEVEKLEPKPSAEEAAKNAAKAIIEKRKLLALIDAEVEKLEPFDLQAAVRKRREKEEKQAQVDAAYKQQYGGGSNKLDQVLEAIEPLRGTIGGVLGKIAGAVMDATTAIRKMQRTAAWGAETGGIATGGSAARGGGGVISGAAAGVASAATKAAITGAATEATATGGTATTEAATGVASAAGGTAVKALAGASTGLVAFGAAIIGAVVAVKAFNAAVETIDKAAERYGEYSPEIAQAQAIAEVRQEMGDMRRAQLLGANMAQYILAQSETRQKWEDVKARFMNAALPAMTGIYNMLGYALPKLIEDKNQEVKDPTDVILGEGQQAQRARDQMIGGVGDQL